MSFHFFSRNGELLPTSDAHVPLSSIEYSYGFGVYETVRVIKAQPYYIEDHLERLMESARLIGLEHSYQSARLKQYVTDLIKANDVDTCNIKILLIGGRTSDDSTLYIECLNPLFPDRKLYKTGAKLISYHYERAFPHAKTLNMLQSYLAYREARKSDAYDALLINNEGYVTEGTRTNIFFMKGTSIYSPPEKDILLGVTRKIVLKVAKEGGFTVMERNIRLDDINEFDAAFITSTSTGVMPISQIDDDHLNISDAFKEFKQKFDSYIELSEGILS